MDLILKSGAIPSTTFGTSLAPLIVDPTYGAGRVTIKPDEYNSALGFQGGHFRWAQVSGALTGAAAASAVVSFRSPPVGYSLVKRIQLGYVLTTAFTTGQIVDFDVVRCTGFTASDTGGTAYAPFIGNNNKKRSNLMNTSQLADLRIASTAALGAGTKTQDLSPFAYLSSTPINLAVPSAALSSGGMQVSDLYAQNTAAEHPEMFQPNEGFNIRVVTALGAGGVLKLYAVVDWAETPGI
jgi:hypothetical protein